MLCFNNIIFFDNVDSELSDVVINDHRFPDRPCFTSDTVRVVITSIRHSQQSLLF